MRTNRETPLCRYHYDALDRLAVCTPAEQASTGRFYQKSRLATEIQGLVQHSIFQYDDQLLAQHQRRGGTVATTLLITDQQRSVLNALDATPPRSLAYTPYGHRPVGNGLLSLLGFNGERPDPVTGHYHLGNGYRQFNPVLMRFNSPDSWSPFREGGINAYAYCAGDPINWTDPTGHVLKKLLLKLDLSDLYKTDFYKTVPVVRDQLGGSAAVKAQAKAVKMPSEEYLLRRTIDYMKYESKSMINSNKNYISASANIEDAINELSRAAIEISSHRTLSIEVMRHLRPMGWEAAADKASRWGAEVERGFAEVKLIASNKVRALARAQFETPPPITRYAPPVPPKPGNTIRKQ